MNAAQQIKQARKRLKSEPLTIEGAQAILDLFDAIVGKVKAVNHLQSLAEAYPAIEKLWLYDELWREYPDAGEAFLHLVRSAANEVLDHAEMLVRGGGWGHAAMTNAYTIDPVLAEAAGGALEAAQAHDTDPNEALADMATSLDRLKASLAAIPADHPLRKEVIEATTEAHGWLVEAEDRARHLAIAVGDPAVLAAFTSGRLVL